VLLLLSFLELIRISFYKNAGMICAPTPVVLGFLVRHLIQGNAAPEQQHATLPAGPYYHLSPGIGCHSPRNIQLNSLSESL